jgi:hypothetical protein
MAPTKGENKNKNTNDDNDNDNDERGGLTFGEKDTSYDSDSAEYVSSLPTEEEERKILAGENVRAREEIEDLDEGRKSNHPSTLASSNKASSAAKEVSVVAVVVAVLVSNIFSSVRTKLCQWKRFLSSVVKYIKLDVFVQFC